MALNAGDRLVNYEIKNVLGKGGFGEVYLAHDTNLDIDVAIKVMHAELSASETILHRMRVGARTAAKLRHPNIQLIYYMGRDTARQVDFVVMEYLPGGNLRQRIAAGRLPLAEALATFTTICSAVEFAHQHGVIHRDLKPDNIMYNVEDKLVVTDFDLARVSGESGRTQVGQMLGTIAYSSPEQIMGNEITAATDIYALGVMLFELVTGQHPFAVSQARRAQRWGNLPTDIMVNPQMDMVNSHLTQPPPRASETNSAVPRQVDDAVLKAMEKDPANRFRSAWELACAVNQQPYSTPASQPPAQPITPPPPMPRPVLPVTPPPPSSVAAPPPVAKPIPVAPPSPPGVSPLSQAPAPPPPSPDVTLRQVQRVFVRVINGALAGQQFSVGNSGLVIGSQKAKNDIALDDMYASRSHARIERQGLTFQLVDLGSANGTKVNGQRVAAHTPVVLSPGDQIEIGYTLLQFELSGK